MLVGWVMWSRDVDPCRSIWSAARQCGAFKKYVNLCSGANKARLQLSDFFLVLGFFHLVMKGQ